MKIFAKKRKSRKQVIINKTIAAIMAKIAKEKT